LQAGTQSIRTRVSIGSDTFVQAEITDTSFVLIKTGLHFWTECSAEEQGPFIAKQVAYLRRREERCSRKIMLIKTHIALTLQAMDTLAHPS
jgi:prefoldin subunit 5